MMVEDFPLHDVPFRAVLSRAASATPRGALSDGQRSVSYAALSERFAELDALCRARGVQPGEVVALECTTAVPGAAILLYLLSRGFSVVLLPPRDAAAPLPVPRFCRWRLTVRSELGASAAERAPHAPGPGLETQGDTRPETQSDAPETQSDAPETQSDTPETWVDLAEVADHRPAFASQAYATGHLFLRTSGSIGTPKLAVYTHDRLLGNALHAIGRLRLTAEDRLLIPVPLAHMFGLGAALLPGLAVGASVQMIEGANLLRYLEHERAYRPTISFLTPALCAMLVRHRRAPEHYRHVVVAGDALRREIFEAAELRFGRVLNLYGSTEMGVISVADADRDDGPRSTTVGTALPGVELRLDRVAEGVEAPEGAGVLACRHPYGFEGYVDGDGGAWGGEPALRDGWYRTRDLGRLLPGGYVEVLGREDHSVNRDGRLVVLAEVERAMERLPGVERAVTVLGADQLRGRSVVAYCALRDGHGLDAARVRDACTGVLPAYAIPDQIVITSALPLLANGKVDRKALAAAAGTQGRAP
jgi:acyl-CoA synthetase (AMP-forming)/AMP-acid ligase II